MPGLNSQTLFLAHWDGADGAKAYTPEVGGALTFDGAQAQLATAQKVFGASSLFAPDTGIPYVRMALGASFNFAGDFAVDFRVRFTRIGYVWVASLYKDASNCLQIYLDNTTNHWTFNLNGTIKNYTEVPTLNTWSHVYWCRLSGVCKMAIDGAQIGTDVTINGAVNCNSGNLHLMEHPSGGYSLPGYLDEVRVQAVPPWTVFPFSVPTEEYRRSSGGIILIN